MRRRRGDTSDFGIGLTPVIGMKSKLHLRVRKTWGGRVNWHDLQILLAFRRHATLARAADTLGIDISTVSRRLRALEADLGVRLVENVGGRLTLTSFGEEAVRAAEAMDVESDALHRLLKGREAVLSGSLRVALLDVFVRFHIDLLESFATAYPDVTLELFSTSQRLHNLTRREADVAVRASRRPDEALVGRKALRLEYAVFAARSLVERAGDYWRSLPWIGYDESAGATETEAWMRRERLVERVRMRVDSPAALFQVVEAGLGAAPLAIPYATRSRDLVRLSDPMPGFGTDLWLLTHRDLRRNARVRAFLDHMYDGLAEWRRTAPKLAPDG